MLHQFNINKHSSIHLVGCYVCLVAINVCCIIFAGLERDTYKVARQSIIDMILATEMTRHFEHLTKFVNVFTKPEPKEDEIMIDSEFGDINTRENIALAKRMLIKCADVSNPTRPLKLCVEWARRIAEEYFNQVEIFS